MPPSGTKRIRGSRRTHSSKHLQAELPLPDDRPFPPGFHFLPGYFDALSQQALLDDIRDVLKQAPLFRQAMPRSGALLSVRTSNAGEFGWVTDREGGYRYQSRHPVNALPWPPIPERLLRLWSDATGEQAPANLCLINFYGQEARLGLHQDRGDSSVDAPVVSVSLGDAAVFAFGGASRQDPLRRLELKSGDVLWFGGPSRLIYHGIDGVVPGTSNLLEEGGRFNLTLRRVTRPT